MLKCLAIIDVYLESASILGRKNIQSTSCTKRKGPYQSDNSRPDRKFVTKNVPWYIFATLTQVTVGNSL